MTHPEVTAAWFNTLVAGDEGRIAMGYMGTTIEGGYNNSLTGEVPDGSGENNATWNAYIGISLDVLQGTSMSVETARLNAPGDVLLRGQCGLSRCQGSNDFLALDLAPDGRPWGSFLDRCHDTCDSDPAGVNGPTLGVAGTLLSGPSLWLDVGTLPVIDPPA